MGWAGLGWGSEMLHTQRGRACETWYARKRTLSAFQSAAKLLVSSSSTYTRGHSRSNFRAISKGFQHRAWPPMKLCSRERGRLQLSSELPNSAFTRCPLRYKVIHVQDEVVRGVSLATCETWFARKRALSAFQRAIKLCFSPVAC